MELDPWGRPGRRSPDPVGALLCDLWEADPACARLTYEEVDGHSWRHGEARSSTLLAFSAVRQCGQLSQDLQRRLRGLGWRWELWGQTALDWLVKAAQLEDVEEPNDDLGGEE